jgi:hypothetical protein
MAIRPPYTPSFGISPPILAGRDDLLNDAMASLHVGPRDPRFCFALLGHRGVGKTTVLDALGARADHELGWPVLHAQAMRDVDLLASLSKDLVASLGRWSRLGRDYHRLEKQLTVTINLGVVSAQANVRSPATTETPGGAAFTDLLRVVGQFARDHDSGVLITIDEAMTGRSSDLAGLAGSIQTVVNRSRLPVAVIFAGLPSFREAIAVAGTFAERLTVQELSDLTLDASRLALVEPAAQHHVTWTPEALELVTTNAAGHPYYLQLFGYHTWLAAGGADTLTADHACSGLQAGRAQLDGQFQTTWGRIRPLEQSVLAALAAQGVDQPAAMADLAAVLQRTGRDLDVPRNRLIHHHGLLRSPSRGRVQFRSPQLAKWVRDNHQPPPVLSGG